MNQLVVYPLILSSILIILIQLLWIKLVNEFPLSKKTYLTISVILILLNMSYSIYFNDFSVWQICTILISMILTNLSIIDYKYYEISGKSYYFLIPIIIIFIFTNGMFNWWTCLISGVCMFLLFFIIDKIVGIEKIGGADVKLMLLISLMFSYYEILILVLLIFTVDVFLWIILAIINKIKNGPKGIKIPMIVAISIATVSLDFICKFILYK